jgi:hypothetical protein
MSKLCLIFALLLALAVAGCASKPSGSREYIPGKGWIDAK